MKDKKTVKLGILGLGVVGSGLVSLIRKNVGRIAEETGISVEIKKVFVRSVQKTRNIDTAGLVLTTDICGLIEDPDIDIICECMGGSGYIETFGYLMKSLQYGKHIILSSKKTLAEYAAPLLTEAYHQRVHIKYDATVGGGIPIAKVFDHAFKGDRLLKIAGIFNATSNFIYSRMFDENQTFAWALKSAQEKGYAENDPTDDVGGFDAANKLVILTLFGLKKIINRTDLCPEPFNGIDVTDMNYAAQLGYRVKPVAMMSNTNGPVNYYVGPCLVPSGHILANTSDNFNTIVLEGEHCGELGFYGQGAGAFPTASAMFDDLMNILSGDLPNDNFPYTTIDTSHITGIPSKFYWRVNVQDKPGILARVAHVLSGYNITIERTAHNHVEVNGNNELVFLTSSMGSKSSVVKGLNEFGIHVQTCMPCLY